MADDVDGAFTVGEKFASYKDLCNKLERFKASHFVDLWIRDSRTIKASQGRVKKTLNPELKYYELKLSCVHGGRKFHSESSGKRSSQ
ncbi:uncharacterized protein LOC130625742 [Hydractinia symbiolongicarpus]|nr:uncharacterized protein LOC130625742 [Hydractinia symbiolongicarpus]